MKEYLLNWLKEHKELIGLFRFDTEQPGNLGSNRQLYNTLKTTIIVLYHYFLFPIFLTH